MKALPWPPNCWLPVSCTVKFMASAAEFTVRKGRVHGDRQHRCTVGSSNGYCCSATASFLTTAVMPSVQSRPDTNFDAKSHPMSWLPHNLYAAQHPRINV
jgi:hypothetical protein